LSLIEWCNRTWNPLEGCTHLSKGCDSCWAAKLVGTRWRHLPLYEGLADDGVFNGIVRLVPARLNEPLGWRKAARTFVCSRSDLFHHSVPDAYIAAVWSRMWWASRASRGGGRKPVQTFQVLTKRQVRMRNWVRGWGDRNQRKAWIGEAVAQGWCDAQDQQNAGFMDPVLDNVWLGVSVEDQRLADIRIPVLIDTPAAVRWLSVEPLLDAVDLSRYLWLTGASTAGPFYDHAGRRRTGGGGAGGQTFTSIRAGYLHWVVAGGETGKTARPIRSAAWAQTLRDQCTEAGVAFFWKQWGDWIPDTDQLPEDSYVALDAAINLAQPHPFPMKVGRKRAGALIDGQGWTQMPDDRTAVAAR